MPVKANENNGHIPSKQVNEQQPFSFTKGVRQFQVGFNLLTHTVEQSKMFLRKRCTRFPMNSAQTTDV